MAINAVLESLPNWLGLNVSLAVGPRNFPKLLAGQANRKLKYGPGGPKPMGFSEHQELSSQEVSKEGI